MIINSIKELIKKKSLWLARHGGFSDKERTNRKQARLGSRGLGSLIGQALGAVYPIRVGFDKTRGVVCLTRVAIDQLSRAVRGEK